MWSNQNYNLSLSHRVKTGHMKVEFLSFHSHSEVPHHQRSCGSETNLTGFKQVYSPCRGLNGEVDCYYLQLAV